jgi:hypothetical protein
MKIKNFTPISAEITETRRSRLSRYGLEEIPTHEKMLERFRQTSSMTAQDLNSEETKKFSECWDALIDKLLEKLDLSVEETERVIFQYEKTFPHIFENLFFFTSEITKKIVDYYNKITIPF